MSRKTLRIIVRTAALALPVLVGGAALQSACAPFARAQTSAAVAKPAPGRYATMDYLAKSPMNGSVLHTDLNVIDVNFPKERITCGLSEDEFQNALDRVAAFATEKIPSFRSKGDATGKGQADVAAKNMKLVEPIIQEIVDQYGSKVTDKPLFVSYLKAQALLERACFDLIPASGPLVVGSLKQHFDTLTEDQKRQAASVNGRLDTKLFPKYSPVICGDITDIVTSIGKKWGLEVYGVAGYVRPEPGDETFLLADNRDDSDSVAYGYAHGWNIFVFRSDRYGKVYVPADARFYAEGKYGFYDTDSEVSLNGVLNNRKNLIGTGALEEPIHLPRSYASVEALYLNRFALKTTTRTDNFDRESWYYDYAPIKANSPLLMVKGMNLNDWLYMPGREEKGKKVQRYYEIAEKWNDERKKELGIASQ
ncbi:MAG: hypothetical protein EDM74_00340 [Armatimonadetes bacterium]|nr:MAG: hypothetical protein EDM74_00340 [Armatimonadota bacterium]